MFNTNIGSPMPKEHYYVPGNIPQGWRETVI